MNNYRPSFTYVLGMPCTASKSKMSDLLSNKESDLDFGSTDFLLQHIRSILNFYDNRCSDSKNGGFFQFFKVHKLYGCNDLFSRLNLIYILPFLCVYFD